MKNYTTKEIVSLIKRFELRKLPKSEWTHEAHLVVAVWYCSKYPFEEALSLVRKNITEHNESVGTENSDAEGYHETITKFWLLIAKNFLKNRKLLEVTDNCNALINSKMGKSNYPLNYYSHSLLFSVNARHNWVTPDLKDIV